MPAFHNLLLIKRKNIQELKSNQTSWLVSCFATWVMSLAGALRGTGSPSSVGARVITEEQWMTIMSKGLSRTETRWGQRCALVQETNSCLIICNWRRQKEEKSGCERRWWGGAGTCLGVLPGFITFRPLCFSPSLSLKPRSLSMNWPAIAHIVCW